MSRSYYRDGDLYVVVETGMPEHNVLVGTGQTITEAIESLDTTPIQSAGSVGEAEKSALLWAWGHGWIGHPDTLEEVDDPGERAP